MAARVEQLTEELRAKEADVNRLRSDLNRVAANQMKAEMEMEVRRVYFSDGYIIPRIVSQTTLLSDMELQCQSLNLSLSLSSSSSLVRRELINMLQSSLVLNGCWDCKVKCQCEPEILIRHIHPRVPRTTCTHLDSRLIIIDNLCTEFNT